MENIGSKIAKLRKTNNLTQAELGEKLNISAQAVSKWEKNLSEPDISTLYKICNIFGITLDEIVQNDEQSEKVVKQAVKQEQPVQRIVLGHCTKCKRPLYSRNDYTVRDNGNGASVICNVCLNKEKISILEGNAEEDMKEFKWGLIVGIPVSILVLVLCLIFNPFSLSIGANIGVSIALLYASFACVSQLFYSLFIQDCLDFFKKSFGLPMILWEFSIDGFIRMLLLKWCLGILCWMLSALLFVCGFIITMVISAFSLPFSLVIFFKERNENKLEIDSYKKMINKTK